MRESFQIDGWVIRPELCRIRKGKKEVRLEPKAMDVLVRLFDEVGHVVSKPDLLAAVWGDAFVTEDVLSRAVLNLRKAFADGRYEFADVLPPAN